MSILVWFLIREAFAPYPKEMTDVERLSFDEDITALGFSNPFQFDPDVDLDTTEHNEHQNEGFGPRQTEEQDREESTESHPEHPLPGDGKWSPFLDSVWRGSDFRPDSDTTEHNEHQSEGFGPRQTEEQDREESTESYPEQPLPVDGEWSTFFDSVRHGSQRQTEEQDRTEEQGHEESNNQTTSDHILLEEDCPPILLDSSYHCADQTTGGESYEPLSEEPTHDRMQQETDSVNRGRLSKRRVTKKKRTRSHDEHQSEESERQTEEQDRTEEQGHEESNNSSKSDDTTGRVSNTCSKCGDTFLHKGALTNHERACKGDQRVNGRTRCKNCSAWIVSRQFSQHIKTCVFEPIDGIPCNTCNRLFGTDIALSNHSRSCGTSDKKFQCEKCGTSCSSSRTITKHKKECNMTKKCLHCELEVSIIGYRKHTNKCESKRTPECNKTKNCPHCGSWLKISSYYRHVRSCNSKNKSSEGE